MSLESGRKLGLTASLIAVIVPVISVSVLVFSIFTSFQVGIANIFFPGIAAFSMVVLSFLIILGSISIAGGIMFIVAMYYLSHYYGEPTIFSNILNAIKIIGVTLVAALISVLLTQFVAVFLALIALVIVEIYGAVLVMRSFKKLGEKSGLDNFKTAGDLYLIGAIIPLVSWIGWIFATIGFRKLKPSSTAISTISYPTQPQSSTAQTKRCPNCGAENRADALYCSSCGKPLT